MARESFDRLLAQFARSKSLILEEMSRRVVGQMSHKGRLRCEATLDCAGLLTLLIAGCAPAQLGIIRDARFSGDGNAVAYDALSRAGVYVADHLGARRIGHRYMPIMNYLLSFDGEWLLASRGEHWDEMRAFGDPLYLWNTRDGRRFQGGLAFNVLPQRHSDYMEGFTVKTNGGQPIPTLLSPVGVFFEEGPRVYFGPCDGHYHIWMPNSAEAPWTRVAADSWHPGPSAHATDHWLDKSDYVDPADSDFLVFLPYDGWNAQRTVWVRPDGSVVELARQNDLPVQIGYYQTISFLNPINWPGLLVAPVYAPRRIAETAERERIELDAGRMKLQRATDLRQQVRGEKSNAAEPAGPSP